MKPNLKIIFKQIKTEQQKSGVSLQNEICELLFFNLLSNIWCVFFFPYQTGFNIWIVSFEIIFNAVLYIIQAFEEECGRNDWYLQNHRFVKNENTCIVTK